jgi:hypothetical protein
LRGPLTTLNLAEVLGPPDLREQMAERTRAMAEIYR